MENRVLDVKTIFGMMKSYDGDAITKQLIGFGAHTRPELSFLLSVIDEGDRVFDIGAHIGTFAVPIARKIGATGELLAVEGHPDYFRLLRENVDANELTARTKLLNYVVAPAGKSYISQTIAGNTGATHFVAGEESSGVPTTTLDDLVKLAVVPNVVKIDIEGLEVWAIGGSTMIQQSHPVIYSEIAEYQFKRFGASTEALDELLRETGYRFFRNVGDRNARHDKYVVAELERLRDGGDFFDMLAIHRDDQKLDRVLVELN